MSWMVFAFGLAAASFTDFDPSKITTTQCREDFLQGFGEFSGAPITCQPYSMLVYHYPDLSSGFFQSLVFNSRLEQGLFDSFYVDQVRCQASNQTTTYVYDMDDKVFADFKALSSIPFEGHEGYKNETLSFSSCADLSFYIKKLGSLKPRSFKESVAKNWSGSSSVAIVASRRNCNLAENIFEDLLLQYRQENREKSQLLCLSDSIVQKKNPSLVRKEIWKNRIHADHLMIVGQDIPVFELISREENAGNARVSYRHGYTDLPYGNADDSFWANAKLKKNWPKAFHQKNNLYLFEAPTKVAYSMDEFLVRVLSGQQYTQSKSVSRWIEAEDFYKDFSAFVERRKKYQPSISQNFVSIVGGEGVLFRVNDSRDYDYAVERSTELIKRFGDSSESRIYSASDLEQALKLLDPNTTFLDLNEHGQPEAMGNLHASDLDEVKYLPPILNLGACFSGSWGLTDQDPKKSLLAQVLNSDTPPLVVVAAQGLTYFRTIGEPDLFVTDVFLSDWRQGQSIGARMQESFQNNFSHILYDLPSYMQKMKADALLQLFSMMSIFGDPSLEY